MDRQVHNIVNILNFYNIVNILKIVNLATGLEQSGLKWTSRCRGRTADPSPSLEAAFNWFQWISTIKKGHLANGFETIEIRPCRCSLLSRKVEQKGYAGSYFFPQPFPDQQNVKTAGEISSEWYRDQWGVSK